MSRTCLFAFAERTVAVPATGTYGSGAKTYRRPVCQRIPSRWPTRSPSRTSSSKRRSHPPYLRTRLRGTRHATSLVDDRPDEMVHPRTPQDRPDRLPVAHPHVHRPRCRDRLCPGRPGALVRERESATSFDAKGARYTHRDSLCSFEVLIEDYKLGADPALVIFPGAN